MPEVAVSKVAASFNGPLPACLRVKELIDHIGARAEELSKARGDHGGGHELEDWTRAEKEMVGHVRAALYEDDDSYEVALQIPGFAAKEIQVAMTPLELGVHAMSSHQLADRPAVWREFSDDEAYRRIHFPTPVDNDSAKATLDNGVVRIHVQKRKR